MERRLAAGPAWEEQDLVFPSRIGTPWLARNFYRAYRVVVERSCIDDPATVTFHALRHTAATQWLAAGADVHVVSRRLGHASPGFTMATYGHLLSGMQSVAAAAFDDLLGAV
jgi:integrase